MALFRTFRLAAAVPADRVAACGIALKLSGGQRDRMRAGRPRSQVLPSRRCGGGFQSSREAAAAINPGVRFQASRAPAPHDGADHPRVKQPFLMAFREEGLRYIKPVCCVGNMDRQD